MRISFALIFAAVLLINGCATEKNIGFETANFGMIGEQLHLPDTSL